MAEPVADVENARCIFLAALLWPPSSLIGVGGSTSDQLSDVAIGGAFDTGGGGLNTLALDTLPAPLSRDMKPFLPVVPFSPCGSDILLSFSPAPLTPFSTGVEGSAFSNLDAWERTFELADTTLDVLLDLEVTVSVDSVSFSELRVAGDAEPLAKEIFSDRALCKVPRKGRALSSVSIRSHVEKGGLEVPRGCDADDDAFAFLRVLGTDEPRNGTEDGPLSCAEEPPLAELANAAMTLGNCNARSCAVVDGIDMLVTSWSDQPNQRVPCGS